MLRVLRRLVVEARGSARSWSGGVAEAKRDGTGIRGIHRAGASALGAERKSALEAISLV